METAFLFMVLLGVASASHLYNYEMYKYNEMTFNHCSNNTDIVLVIDSSGSISPEDFQKMQVFVINLGQELNNDGVFVGIVLYSTCAKVVRSLGPVHNFDDFEECVSDMEHLRGLTNTYLGLKTAKELIVDSNDAKPDRANNAKFVILLSDGASTRDCDRIPDIVYELQDMGVDLITIGVGNAGTQGTIAYSQMQEISSNGEVISVHSYSDLSADTVESVCKDFKIINGNPCPPGTPDVPTFCGTFSCVPNEYYGGSYWVRLWIGCPHKGECVTFGNEIVKPESINEYECRRPMGCDPNAESCPSYFVVVTQVACEVDGNVIKEGDTHENEETCRTERCMRYFGPYGPYGRMVVTAKRCVRDGQCYDVGTTYDEGCSTYRCSSAGYFAPSNQGCSYKGECIDEGEHYHDTEECVHKRCVLNMETEKFEMQTWKLECKDYHNNVCRDLGATWTCEGSCVQYECVEENGKAVEKETIIGCRKHGECIDMYDVTTKVNNTCIIYECRSDGSFDILQKECIDAYGKCHPHDDRWRPYQGCWENVCKVIYDPYYPTVVKTDIIRVPDCTIEGRCVLRGHTQKIGCILYKCDMYGKVHKLEQDCPYQGGCIKVNDPAFLNSECKMVSCHSSFGLAPYLEFEEYGCVYNGKCYKPGDVREDSYNCLTYMCDGDKHQFYPNVCRPDDTVYSKCINPGQTYFDEEDCLMEECKIDSYPPGAFLDIVWNGCTSNGKCYKPNETRQTKCLVEKCTGNNNWETVSEECEDEYGNCRPVGDEWFSKTKCAHLVCIRYQDGVMIDTTYEGCTSNYECLQHGEGLDHGPCIKFTCEDGVLKQDEAGCELNGHCLPAGQDYEDRELCEYFICKADYTDPNKIRVQLIRQQGCRDCDQCYFVGETKDLHCKTYVCKNPYEPMHVEKINGCIDEEGNCKCVGAVWENRESCMKRICLLDGTILDIPIGCLDSNNYDECVRFDYPLNTGGQKCVRHICKRVDNKPYRHIEYTGCVHGSTCLPFGDSYVDEYECKRYKCQSSESGNPSYVKLDYGCISDIDGQCYPFNSVQNEDDNECIEYTCRETCSFVVTKAQCSYDYKCRVKDSRWEVVENDECMRFTCKRERLPNSYRVRMYEEDERGCMYADEYRCVWDDEDVKPGNCTTYRCNGETGNLDLDTLKCTNPLTGACMDIGSTYDGPRGCKRYRCDRVNYSETKFTETIIGCDPGGNGRCYEDGEDEKTDCSVFECDASTGVMEAIKKRCKGPYGKCMEDNEYFTDSSCITYTCLIVDGSDPNEFTAELEEKQGCKHGDKCYVDYDTIEVNCITKTCKSGCWEDTTYRCTREDGTCYANGETYESPTDCTTYVCVSDSHSADPIEYGCKIRGECYDVGKRWFDERRCRYYECVFDPETGTASPDTIQLGCRAAGKCLSVNVTQDDDCNKVECVNGRLQVVSAGCEWENGCKRIHETWWRGCVFHRCVVKGRSPVSISTRIVFQRGCSSCIGCQKPNADIRIGCIQQKCLRGGHLITTKIQCMDPETRKCVDEGAEIKVNGVKKECTEHGGFKVIPKPTHCNDGRGGKVSIGQRWKDETLCKEFECRLQGYVTECAVLERGCLTDDGECYWSGEPWFDYEDCTNYKCVSETDEYGYRSPRIISQKECYFYDTKLCRRIGDQWTEDCKEMECTASNDYDDATVTIISQSCKSEQTHACHNPGAKWSESNAGQCYAYVCVEFNGINKPKVLRPVCRDYSGRCKEVGSTYYDCETEGAMHHDCYCTSDDGHAHNSYGTPEGISYDSSYDNYESGHYNQEPEVSYGSYGGSVDYGTNSYGSHDSGASYPDTSNTYDSGASYHDTSNTYDSGASYHDTSNTYDSGASYHDTSNTYDSGASYHDTSNTYDSGASYPDTSNTYDSGASYHDTSNTYDSGASYHDTSNTYDSGASYHDTSNTYDSGASYHDTSNTYDSGASYPDTSNTYDSGASYHDTSNTYDSGASYHDTSNTYDSGASYHDTSNTYDSGASYHDTSNTYDSGASYPDTSNTYVDQSVNY